MFKEALEAGDQHLRNLGGLYLRYPDSEEKTKLKKEIRSVASYKLSVQLCLLIKELKGQKNDEEKQVQAASLSNLLVLPQVDEDTRRLFY